MELHLYFFTDYALIEQIDMHEKSKHIPFSFWFYVHLSSFPPRSPLFIYNHPIPTRSVISGYIIDRENKDSKF